MIKYSAWVIKKHPHKWLDILTIMLCVCVCEIVSDGLKKNHTKHRCKHTIKDTHTQKKQETVKPKKKRYFFLLVTLNWKMLVKKGFFYIKGPRVVNKFCFWCYYNPM